MDWRLITTILCTYGFFKEFRPLEPFLTPFLRSEPMNFTDVQLYSRVYPVWTYSYLAALIPVFLLTDLLRYNAVLIFGAFAYCATWALLIFGRTVGEMQTMQFFYGLATASEVGYFSYIYAAVEGRHYKKVTSYVKAALECGRFLSHGLSQILISTYLGDYNILNYISAASCVVIVFISACLPCVGWRKQKKFDSPVENGKEMAEIVVPADENKPLKISNEKPEERNEIIFDNYRRFVRNYFENLWSNFKGIYSKAFMWRWSLWCALATCGFFQVGNYVQNLWDLLQTDRKDVWNGVVEAVSTFFSIIVVFAMQFIRVRWAVWGELMLTIIAMFDCGLLIIMSQTKSLVVAYVFYIVFRIMYKMMITIAMYNIAKRMTVESYGLVFGFNTFGALLLQTILTIAVADEAGFALDIRNQFLVYGLYHGAVAIIFALMGIYTFYQYRRGRSTEGKQVDDKPAGEIPPVENALL